MRPRGASLGLRIGLGKRPFEEKSLQKKRRKPEGLRQT